MYENPQIQAWIEEQRQKLQELLRLLGEELDPATRRQAEALAAGESPYNNDSLRREEQASQAAAAVATGRSTASSSAATTRRIPVRGPDDPDLAEERRRKGREYLARRNQQMYELQLRRSASQGDATDVPPSPTSFDDMVNEDGSLKVLSPRPLPSVPVIGPVPATAEGKIREADPVSTEPLLADSAQAGMSGWSMGSRLANPFGDEFEMQVSGSMTPKPPVPPKIREEQPTANITSMSGTYPTESGPQIEESVDTDGLSYEEQIAIALSLSEVASQPSSATVRQEPEGIDAGLAAAIAASLREMDAQQAAHAIDHSESTPSRTIPLIDVTPDPPVSVPQSHPGQTWGFLPSSDHLKEIAMDDPPISVPDSDELYRVTPQLTRARLATHDESNNSLTASPSLPVSDAARSIPLEVEASFYSARSPSPLQMPALVDVAEEVQQPSNTNMHTPSSATESFGFHTDSGSDSGTFASMSGPASRSHSHTRSEVEVLDITGEDSNVDMLSEEGDGVATPDSWTEVGSQDGDSSADEHRVVQA